ncbi:MAG: putative polysaccharide polymerase [Rickettsiaceae bacterium]|nr:putative polysaccharide polymerase [Rickettsiaceae bacterium]
MAQRTKANYKAALILFIAVLATIARLESFSSTLGYLAGGLVFPLVYFKQEKIIKAFAVLAVVFVFAIPTAAKIMDAHKMVGSVPVIAGAASDFRLYIWDYAAEQAYKKPIFGWGMNSTKSYPVQESDYVQGGRNPLPLHPHNNTLQIWLELGAVGLVIFAAFLYFALIRIPQVMQDKLVMASGAALFANYFVIGQTAYGIWQNWWIAGGILALAFLKLTTSKS